MVYSLSKLGVYFSFSDTPYAEIKETNSLVLSRSRYNPSEFRMCGLDTFDKLILRIYKSSGKVLVLNANTEYSR